MTSFDTPIRFKTLIRAPQNEIYEVLTTAAGWDLWFTEGMKFKLLIECSTSWGEALTLLKVFIEHRIQYK